MINTIKSNILISIPVNNRNVGPVRDNDLLEKEHAEWAICIYILLKFQRYNIDKKIVSMLPDLSMIP